MSTRLALKCTCGWGAGLTLAPSIGGVLGERAEGGPDRSNSEKGKKHGGAGEIYSDGGGEACSPHRGAPPRVGWGLKPTDSHNEPTGPLCVKASDSL